jgi:glycosidase
MKKLSLISTFTAIIIAVLLTACSQPAPEIITPSFTSAVVHPDWSKNSVLYEVNTRQYTPEGTFKAFEAHLPRLKSLGVDVLWFMPIFPIGIQNKKGELGSYYSVRDYMDVNPEFGKLDDFKSVINKAHELGMKVVIDWVPNHTSWDNKLTAEHPDWYMKDSTGRFMPPIGFDWTDVIQLDWSKKELQDYMIGALKFWQNLGVDGFRIDHPHNTPPEFWERARAELSATKPVLLIGEIEEPTTYLEKGYDMNYAWELYHLTVDIAQGRQTLGKLIKYYDKEKHTYPNSVYRLQFLTNHDQNSWEGTIDTLMGPAQKPLAALIFTAQGVPLIYTGQEVCLNKRIKFFVRDTVKWDTCSMTGFYRQLVTLKKHNQALWNGDFGGPMKRITTGNDSTIFAYSREMNDSRVVVFLNLSNKTAGIKPSLKELRGHYTDYFSGTKIALPLKDSLRFEPWGFKILVK